MAEATQIPSQDDVLKMLRENQRRQAQRLDYNPWSGAGPQVVETVGLTYQDIAPEGNPAAPIDPLALAVEQGIALPALPTLPALTDDPMAAQLAALEAEAARLMNTPPIDFAALATLSASIAALRAGRV